MTIVLSRVQASRTAARTRDSRRRSIRCYLLGTSLLSVVAGCHAAPQAASLAIPATAPAAELQRFDYHQIKLGSDFNLVIYAPDKAAADAASAAAFAEVDRLDPIFNDYKPDSEISKLSLMTRDGPMKEPVSVSPELFDLLWEARRAAEATGGAFDPTVGPFVQLWRRSRRLQQAPSPERIAEAKSSVGWRHLELTTPFVGGGGPAAPFPLFGVKLTAPKMRLDLGGIAGGYVADRVLDLLKKRGLPRCLVDSSGDLAVGDPPPGRPGWRVAVQALTEPNKVAEYLEVANCGVSTSGDTYRFVEIDNVRYSHIVDVNTGLGLINRVGVTTIAADGTTADWLATSVSVMGVEKGLALIENLNKDEKRGGVGARVTTVNDAGKATVTESSHYKKFAKAAEGAS